MTINFTIIGKLYLTYLLCTLPASKTTKRPTVPWKAFQERLPTDAAWDEWDAQGKTTLGICIVTGKVSGYLIVIDFDDKGSRFKAWCNLLPIELRDRLVVARTPSGGYHVYVRYESEGSPIGNVKLARTEDGRTLIETRGEGGLVIAPPTPGYELLSGKFDSIPVLSCDEWDLLHNAAQSFDESAKRSAPTVNTTSVEVPVTPGDLDDAVHRAIAYISSMPEAIEGYNGSAAALRVCNKLYEFGLDIDTAKWGFMTFYNPRCLPEWSEKEIDHKLDTAYNKPLREAGCMLVADIVLNPKDPLASADKFLETCYTLNGIPTLIHYAGSYWQWKGNVYREIEDGEIESRLLYFAEQAKVECPNDDGVPGYAAFPVEESKLRGIEKVLKRRVYKSAGETIVPCWIGGESCEIPASVADPSSLIFGKSTILNLADMEILPPTPHWLNIAALDFDYDPNAECPQWLLFLNSIFGDDEESKQTLMEWMGLCLTTITKFQKSLFIRGRRRSGKGTIGRTLQKIVGTHNAISPRSSSFGSNFGLQPFIGKTLAIVSDARFARNMSPQLIEAVLNITGEDAITISRKYKGDVTLRLQTKLMFMSNEVPIVTDQSGAFAGRFIFLQLPKTFYGREDTELEEKLSRELPGILRLAIRHLPVLLERGYFIQPETGKGLAERMMALSSPVGEFSNLLQPGMTKDEIWDKWTVFCDNEGQKHGTRNELWNNLESAGYRCDIKKSNLLEKIRLIGREVCMEDFRRSTNLSHQAGGAAQIRQMLAELVEEGHLTVRYERAGNGSMVAYYRISCSPKLGDAYDEFC